MKMFIRFSYHFLGIIGRLKSVLLFLITLIVIGAAAISQIEDLPFGEALYFSFITGLTIGYGDIVVNTLAGRLFAILTGFVGMLFSGLTIAIAVYALRKSFHDSQNLAERERGSS